MLKTIGQGLDKKEAWPGIESVNIGVLMTVDVVQLTVLIQKGLVNSLGSVLISTGKLNFDVKAEDCQVSIGGPDPKTRSDEYFAIGFVVVARRKI